MRGCGELGWGCRGAGTRVREEQYCLLPAEPPAAHCANIADCPVPISPVRGAAGMVTRPRPVGEAARVVHEVGDGDRSAVVGEFGEVPMDVVVEAQLPGLLQQRHREGRERLGN